MTKSTFLNLLSLALFISCSSTKSGDSNTSTDATKIVAKKVEKPSIVKIDELLTENLSSRAILIDKNFIWYAGSGGKVGKINMLTKEKTPISIEGIDEKTEFRSIAQTNLYVFVLTIGSPGRLYKIDKVSNKAKKVFEEKHEKTFFDSMQFLNNNEGFAVGDPVSECPMFIKTVNAGSQWTKKNCTNLPKLEEGEAFFATSNSNLILRNKSIFLITGGKKSRVGVSNDKGITWTMYDTPIVQGEQMTGAFCADFFDEFTGFIAGGNYEKQDLDVSNKAITLDGGQTWKTIGDNQGLGFISCVKFVPEGKGKAIVAAAANGMFLTTNYGKTWKLLSEDKDIVAFKFLTPNVLIASGKDRIIKYEFK